MKVHRGAADALEGIDEGHFHLDQLIAQSVERCGGGGAGGRLHAAGDAVQHRGLREDRAGVEPKRRTRRAVARLQRVDVAEGLGDRDIEPGTVGRVGRVERGDCALDLGVRCHQACARGRTGEAEPIGQQLGRRRLAAQPDAGNDEQRQHGKDGSERDASQGIGMRCGCGGKRVDRETTGPRGGGLSSEKNSRRTACGRWAGKSGSNITVTWRPRAGEQTRVPDCRE